MKSSLKIYAFFLCILAFSIYFVLQPPQKREEIHRAYEEVAKLELENFALYSIKDRKPQLLVIGSNAYHFDNREEFIDLFLANFGLQKNKQTFTQKDIEYFHVGKAIKRKDIYEFSKGIDYLNESGIAFIADKGIYDSNNQQFRGEGDFELKNTEGEFWGEDLYFDGITSEIRASLPRGMIWLDQ
uniref:LPS export ABC transporter periplasmic protein LptC n=1 Tax=Helicobacter cholecystus TaxID=45498 RepID=A0A3D8IXL2_9HELI|nr:hypothetical protein [Helicobacter cholecystus]RDU69655.1 hypothetical protein CQA62_03130 [Helicobacter cholecystus]VEJ24216.1 Uncharacterised protein [Helicobacter cholecystus]